MKLLLALFLFTLTAAGLAGSLEQTHAARGQLIVTQFATAPFPHPARAHGHKYNGKEFPAPAHYSDSTVAIFIPKGFRETGTVDFVIHFHGWYNTVAGTLDTFKLVEQLVASGKNAVLVVPAGPCNAPDSYGGKLEDTDGFKRFMAELTATLKQRAVFKKDFTVGNLILSGHSGGYRVMSAIVDRGGLSTSVKEVWLFDALYAGTDKFLAWSDREHGRLLNIYTDRGGTKGDSEAMMGLLKQRGTAFVVAEETKLTPEELQSNKLVFIHTDLGHNDVVAKREQFRLFLKTSLLADLKPAP